MPPEGSKSVFREVEVRRGQGLVFGNSLFQDGGVFEKRNGDAIWIEGLDETVAFGGADSVSNGSAFWKIGFRVGIDVASLSCLGEKRVSGDGGKNGLGGFEMAKVVGAVEEVFGAGAEFVVVEVKGLFGREFFLGPDDEIDAAAGFSAEDVIDTRGVAVV